MKTPSPLQRTPPKKERLPWRNSVTLCVAAQCVDGGHDKVVVAFEYSMETGIAQAEIEYRKLNWIGCEHFPVLMAGTQSRCREMIGHIDGAWHERKQGVDFFASCREGIRRFKKTLANEYIGARLGMSYEEMLGKKRRSIPKDKYSELVTDVARMKLGGEILFVYFSPDESELVRIEDDGSLEICSNFAAVGSGTYIAEASLFHRQHSRNANLANALYCVYEAMRLGGSHGPGVGEKFTMGIVQFSPERNDAMWTYVTPAYQQMLGEEFKKYGPRKLRGQVVHRELLQKLYLLKNTKRKAKKSPG